MLFLAPIFVQQGLQCASFWDDRHEDCENENGKHKQ